jgi:hypothetical protein
MKYLSENRALRRLTAIKNELRNAVLPYERRARSCGACDTPGACCLDAHFVNVHISRLESAAIRRTLGRLGEPVVNDVERRIDTAIATYQLSAHRDTFEQRYACPLFEPGKGCLVHHDGKPSACVVHACYENSADLPPDEIQQRCESSIDDLNTRTYGRPQRWLPIPLALRHWR